MRDTPGHQRNGLNEEKLPSCSMTQSESSHCTDDKPEKSRPESATGEVNEGPFFEQVGEEEYEIVEEIILDSEHSEAEDVEEIVEVEIDDESELSEEASDRSFDKRESYKAEEPQQTVHDDSLGHVELEQLSVKNRDQEGVDEENQRHIHNTFSKKQTMETDEDIELSSSQTIETGKQTEMTFVHEGTLLLSQSESMTRNGATQPSNEENIVCLDQHQGTGKSVCSNSSLEYHEEEPRMRAPSMSAPNSPSRRWKSPTRNREEQQLRPQSEHKEYEWEKPAWTKASLKSTGKGVYLKQGSDLQSPITHIPKQSDSTNKEANSSILRSSISPPITPKAYEWTKPTWTKAQLRATGKGEYVRQGSDLQGPITHVQKNTMVDINFEANPMVLRPTDKGSFVRLGENLAKPITHCEKNPMADVNFEANPAFVLQETEYGKKVKSGNSLAKPVTFPEKRISDINFDANPAVLKRTEKGKLMKAKGDLQGPITHVEKNTMDDINFEANPMVLKSTEKGKTVRMGEKLERPITHIAKSIKE